MKIVGLTGGIGSGKSTVLNIFKELGVKTYNADISAKKIINSDQDIIKSIKNFFGENTYKNNILDSKMLSSIVFKNPSKLNLLNSIVHPAVDKDFNSFLNSIDENYIVKEAAIIFEINSEINYDKIILVRSPKKIRIERVVKRDIITEEEVIKRMNNQIDDVSILDKCDYIIDNHSLGDLQKSVQKIHADLINQN